MGEAELRAEVEELRERLVAAEAELADRRQFVARVMDAEDRARRRIAQLIHDDALQSLLAANQELIEAAPGRAGVTRAHQVVSASIENLREALLSLHPVTLERGGLEQALGALARRAESQAGLDVSLSVAPEAVGRGDTLVLALARELLANAARHSGASAVSVAVTLAGGGDGEGEKVRLEVSDDGKGMSPDRPREALASGHIGLASVFQRAEAAGGGLELESEPGSGTRAVATIPA